MRTSQELNWLAGLLEGEGTFVNAHATRRWASPVIQLVITDKDVVIRAAKLMGANRVIECQGRVTNVCSAATKPLPMYRFRVGGRNAVSWCMTLYGLFGGRRRLKISELLRHWKTARNRPYPDRRKSAAKPTTIVVWENSGA